MVTNPTRLLSPEEIAVQAGQQVPFLRLPERTRAYAERAMRLRQRASSSPAMRDYLLFIAALAEAQQTALLNHPAVPLPDVDALTSAARLGAAPLPATLWPRDPAWRGVLRGLLADLHARLADGAARRQVAALRDADDATWLERQADRLLANAPLDLDLATAPLIAAALQVHWTHLVLAAEAACSNARVGAEAPANASATADATARTPAPISLPYGRVDDPTRCPCCASLPTASIVRIGGDDGGFRYLHCSLCSTQWHLVRIKCSRCLSTQGIHYHSLQLPEASGQAAGGRQPAVEAETCDACGHYLKLVHMARDAEVEPIADDLASVTLDLMVAEAGYARHGVDLLLLFGDDADADVGDDTGALTPRGDRDDEGSADAAPPRGA